MLDKKQLLEEIAQGNEQAFSSLFYMFLPELEPYVFRFAKDKEAAKEIIQNSFIRLWLHRDKLAEVDNPRAYLYKYVTHECLSFLRNDLRHQKAKEAAVLAEKSNQNYQPFDKFYVDDLKKIINQIIDKMPARRKLIYQMSRGDGKNINEIAAELQISPNTVKNTLVVVLKILRENLVKQGLMALLLAPPFFY